MRILKQWILEIDKHKLEFWSENQTVSVFHDVELNQQVPSYMRSHILRYDLDQVRKATNAKSFRMPDSPRKELVSVFPTNLLPICIGLKINLHRSKRIFQTDYEINMSKHIWLCREKKNLQGKFWVPVKHEYKKKN